jgi:SAM-dependent methyltransferase
VSAEQPCDLCGATARTRLYDVNGVPIARCDSCGLVFADAGPGSDELLDLYDRDYYEDPDEVGYAGYADAEARKRHHDRSLLDEIERIRKPGSMLEIGCAYGFFLDEARTRGWQVRGIEPSEHAASEARERLGLDVTTKTFTDLPAEPASLDAIVLWDVIEHLPNPRATIEAAEAWLRPGGVLALSTGDFGSLSARLHGADWSLMTPPWHQFYFSRKTLRRLLTETGFDVVKVRGDGSVAVDPGSRKPRIRGAAASVLEHRLVTTVARKLGAGSIMFAFARKGAS